MDFLIKMFDHEFLHGAYKLLECDYLNLKSISSRKFKLV